MNGKNPFDLIEDLREKILEEIQTFTVFHWIRLGITFGLLFWVRFVIGAIIMGRAIEKVFVVYQMGVLEQENNYTFSNIIYNFYCVLSHTIKNSISKHD